MEDFVSFELAKKLEGLGFDESSIFFYREDDEDKCVHCVDINKPLIDDKVIIAPTISQVLKWLRKEKKIHICIDFDGDMNWYYQIAIFGSTDIAADGYVYNDYEMSALAGIERVLDNFI